MGVLNIACNERCVLVSTDMDCHIVAVVYTQVPSRDLTSAERRLLTS